MRKIFQDLSPFVLGLVLFVFVVIVAGNFTIELPKWETGTVYPKEAPQRPQYFNSTPVKQASPYCAAVMVSGDMTTYVMTGC